MSSDKPPYTKSVLSVSQKLVALGDIRREIKKKRFVLDEGKERFGLDEMSQLTKVKNTSEVKGYPFKALKRGLSFGNGLRLALKVVPIETKYEKHEHPSHLENLILKELTDNVVCKNISPHIAYYIATQKVGNKSRALKFLNLKRLEVEEKIRTHSNMLISEYVEGGSLDSWVFNTYEDDKEVTDDQWRSIVFQLIYTIAVIQKQYRMMHNDFHYGNILIDDTVQPGGYFVYEIAGKKFYIKNTGVIPKLWDFEFSMVYSNAIKDCYPNKFIVGNYKYDRLSHTAEEPLASQDRDDFNVPYNFNEVYDLHYFLTSLLDLYISQELFDWILKIYPDDVIPEEESSLNNSSSSSSLPASSTYDSPSSHSSSTATSSASDAHTSSNASPSADSTSSSSSSCDSSSCGSNQEYLCDGRLRNGVEKIFDLPTPLSLLDDTFFAPFTTVPEDFDPSQAIVFTAGF